MNDNSQQQTQHLRLYESPFCPYCTIVRRAVQNLKLDIASCDTREMEHWKALQAGGGKSQVPCLRIEENNGVKWLYESSDIIRYLSEKFA